MAENFRLSLQVAVLGMALVILTLLIVAAIIMLLGRVFKPKPATLKVPAMPAEVQDATCDTPAITPATIDLSDEAIAIALAIALQRGYQRAPRSLPSVAYSDTEVIGEVVSVVSIEPGAGIWAGIGRLQPSK